MLYFQKEIASLLPQLKARLTSPWLILLEGDLGVGKTTWTQEFVEALGGNSVDVKSPTFLKLLTHDIHNFGHVLHIDAYRIDDIEEFVRLGMESYEHVSAIVVEWPQIFMEFLESYPEYRQILGLKNLVRLELKIQPGGGSRLVNIDWQDLSNR